MSTTFMNLENSENSDAHKLRQNLTDKIDLRRGYNRVTLSKLNIYYTWKKNKKFLQK